MSLQELTISTLELQKNYSSANTPDMERRGLLIRTEIPRQLNRLRAELLMAGELTERELLIEGRDATGRKAEIPWVRIASRELSPRATMGWYLVWLYRKDGSGVYLALAHGSTEFKGGSFVPRNDHDLKELMKWGGDILLSHMAHRSDLVTDIDLVSNGPLAVAYQKSCVAALYYPIDEIPIDFKLQQDLVSMISLLGKLYQAEKLGQAPGSINPEIREAEAVAIAIARPGYIVMGQGTGLSAEERRAVELRAMNAAITFLRSQGYSVEDVSRTESFDLLAKLDVDILKVEVKGTTGALASILLTANEVALHKDAYPSNALIVLHSIQLSNEGGLVSTSGGELRAWIPWLVDEKFLRPINFSYQLIDKLSI